MYKSKRYIYRNVYYSMCGLVKIKVMKIHIVLQALFKHTGLKKASKDICKDRNIGTWKALNMEMITH